MSTLIEATLQRLPCSIVAVYHPLCRSRMPRAAPALSPIPWAPQSRSNLQVSAIPGTVALPGTTAMPLSIPQARRLGLSVTAALVVGCAKSSVQEDSDDPTTAVWFDTGIMDAPDDMTWEAEDEAAEERESAPAEAGYDGLRPRHPEVAEADHDEAYRAGEMVHVAFDLENIGDEDYLHHPGLILSTEHPDVEVPDGNQWVESLAAGERVSMAWWAVLGPTVRSGDEVRFTASVSAWDCEASPESCPVAHTASITVTVH